MQDKRASEFHSVNQKVTCKNDEVVISEEHDDYGWFSHDEVEEMIEKDLRLHLL